MSDRCPNCNSEYVFELEIVGNIVKVLTITCNSCGRTVRSKLNNDSDYKKLKDMFYLGKKRTVDYYFRGIRSKF